MIGLFQKIRGKRSINYTAWQLQHLQAIKNLAVDYTMDNKTFNDERFHELIEYLWGDPADSVERIDWNKTERDYPRISYLNEITKNYGFCNIENFRFMHMGFSIGYRNRMHPKIILDSLDKMPAAGQPGPWHIAEYGILDERNYWLVFNYEEKSNRLYPYFAFDCEGFSSTRQILAEAFIERNSNGNNIVITNIYKDLNNKYSVTDYRMAGELILILGMYLLCNPHEFDRAIRLSKKFPRANKNNLIVD